MKFRYYMLLLVMQMPLYPQDILMIDDPCGYDPEYAAATLELLGAGWGYNYDSLLTDLEKWGRSPFATVDSAGASVQDRGIWLITIKDTLQTVSPALRITVHARTHPAEVQSTWVTNAIIDALLGTSDLAVNLRRHCEFNIIPMYNPDGVELGFGRENANGIDLERQWNTAEPEPETAVLRGLFESYMAGESPIRVALNMHSAGACKRYFVYHHENGTSEAFAVAQQFFISSIREKWPEGIEPWNYYISWTGGTPLYYPESWFWLNFQEAVMALTYEDMNCPEAGEYDRTANALLEGITDFLGIRETAVDHRRHLSGHPELITDISTFPNPVTAGARTNIRFSLREPVSISLRLYDLLGRKIADLGNTAAGAGEHVFSIALPQLAQGYYVLQISGPLVRKSVPLMIFH